MDNFEQELKIGFLSDANDLMFQMDKCLNQIDNSEIDLNDDNLNLIFRLVHTLKGNSNACGLEELGKATHLFEDALILVRRKEAPNNQSLVELAHLFCDTINDALAFYRSDLSNNYNFYKIEEAVNNYLLNIDEYQRPKNLDSEDKILIIDDDMDFANYISLFIKKEFKLNCDFAVNGELGYQKACAREYKCIVCDFEMPLMKGTDFVEKIRTHIGPNQHNMILFTSAYSRLQFFPTNTGFIEDVVFINKPVHLHRFAYYLKFGLVKSKTY